MLNKEKFKLFISQIGLLFFIIITFLTIGLVIAMMIKSGAWISEQIYPLLLIVSEITFAVILFVFIPLSLFRKTRYYAGKNMMIASYVFGVTLWIWGFVITYKFWGVLGIVIGILLLGVGVVPMAMLAAIFNTAWYELLKLGVLLFITYCVRTLGNYILETSPFE